MQRVCTILVSLNLENKSYETLNYIKKLHINIKICAPNTLLKKKKKKTFEEGDLNPLSYKYQNVIIIKLQSYWMVPNILLWCKSKTTENTYESIITKTILRMDNTNRKFIKIKKKEKNNNNDPDRSRDI